MLDVEQAVRTSESSGYKTQALVKDLIALCGAFSLTFGMWAEFWRRSFAALILFSSLQRAPDPRRRRFPDWDRRHHLAGIDPNRCSDGRLSARVERPRRRPCGGSAPWQAFRRCDT